MSLSIPWSHLEYNLEDVRVPTYCRLCNLIALVLTVSYFLVAYLGESLRLAILTRKVLRASKRLYGIAALHYYALSDGVAYILGRARAGFWRPAPMPTPSRQLTLPGLS